MAFTLHLLVPAALGFILTAVEQVLSFHFISTVEIFMCGLAQGCSSERIVLHSF